VSDAHRPIPLGKHFLDRGRITLPQLETALAYRQDHGVKLGQALVALGYIDEGELVEALKVQGKVFCVDLSPGIVDPKVAVRLGEKASSRFRALAFNQIATTTTVAMEDPTDVLAIDEIAMRLQTRVFPVFAEPAKIDRAIQVVFGKEALKLANPEAASSVDKLALIALQEESGEGSSLASGKNVDLTLTDDVGDGDGTNQELDKPIINMVRSLLEDAFVQRASDLHLEPRKKDVLVRFRVDGDLFERTVLPKSWAGPMLARIKVLANLDIAQRRLPQDGRMQFRYKGANVDLRVATSPTIQGECAVLRILDGGRDLHSLEQLDFDEKQREQVERIIQCREGFVLATGPTGSGKTTTLYAILQRLAGVDRKIVTLEDPVENEMDGITQINANAKIGMTFARGLRSILRQDPDVILVGEIRDQETAQIGVQAALTGHIVLSTLHTVGAAETITRLADMGIEPYLLADTLRGIVAQRLLRRICLDCKTLSQPDPSILERLQIQADGSRFFEGKGCDACHGSGYRSRIGIYEVMQLSPRLCRLVEKNEGTDALNQAAIEEGLITLREDGIRKARAGHTTLAEVLAATTRG
jgi:type IV pilus assembly protein PilB